MSRSSSALLDFEKE